MVRRLALPVLHVLLAFLAVRAGAVPAQWLPPRDVSLGGEAGRVSGVDICARGPEVIVVWSDARLGGRRLFWRRSRDFGATWEPEALVTAAGPTSTQPAIACDDEFVYLVWIRGDSGSAELRFSRFAGATWGAAVSVSPGTIASAPAIAVTRAFPGAVGVVFERAEPTTTRAMFTFSDDDGDTWADASPTTRLGAPSARPAIAASGELFYLAWQDFREDASHVYFTTRGPMLVGAERRLSNVGGSGAPSLSATGRRVLAAWESKPGLDGPDIYATVSENEGLDWGIPTPLTDSAPQSARPTTLILDDAAYVAWQDGSLGAFEAFLARRDGARSWESPARLTESPQASILPRLSASFPDGAPSRDAAAQLQLAWIERVGDGGASVAHAARDTLAPDRPDAPRHVDVSARPGWDDDTQALFRWGGDPSAAAYRVFVSVDGGVAREASRTDIPEARLDGLTGVARVSVVAEDAVGNRSEVSAASDPLLLDADPPVVTIAQPQDGAVLFAEAPVRVSCRDDNLRSCVVEYGATQDPSVWTPLAEVFTESFDVAQVGTIPATTLSGVYTLRVRAEDHAGSVAAAVVRFVVDDSPPLIVETGASAPLLAANDLATGRRDAAWSPRQDVVAFVSDEGGAQDVWVARSDGSDAATITTDEFVDASPAWGPNGAEIAFASKRADEWDIYITTLDGQVTPLDLSATSNDIDPAWSPDGSSLAFASDRDGDFELYVLENLAGDTPSVVQVTRNGVDDRRPSWSPGGTALAYESARGVTWDVRQVDIATGDDRQLTASFDSDLSPDYHPNGKQILFTRVRGDGSAELHVYDLVARTTRRASPPGIDARFGVWSRSGGSIVFEQAGDLALAPLTFPESRLEARITAPANNSFLSSTTDVVGVARGSDMASYRLEFAEVGPGETWAPITGDVTSPVTDIGFLGRWDPRGLSGEYRLRLTVTGENGGTDVSEIRAHVRDTRPQLAVSSPGDGAETLSADVTVIGAGAPGATITLNGERVSTDARGRFEFQHAISPGVNDLEFRADDLSGLEAVVTRRVIRVMDAPSIVVTSPAPFEALAAPYVEVSGVAPGAVSVLIDGEETPLTVDGQFSRVLAVDEEQRVIRVVATDRFGREVVEDRLTLYSPGEAAGRADTNPPALVEPDPPAGATLTTGRFPFRARIVDDRGFDPDTLSLTFDGEKLDTTDWDFDTGSGDLTYDPDVQLGDGEHILTVSGADLVGNTLVFGELRVTVDTQPTILTLSALPETADATDVRVVLTSNRALSSVLNAQARETSQLVGFPLAPELTGVDAPFTYEAHLALGFASEVGLSATVRDLAGTVTTVTGGFAVATLSARASTVVSLPDGAAVVFAPTEGGSTRRVVFRTQDGLDLPTTVAQRRGISDRELEFGGEGTAMYVVETVEEGGDLPAFELTTPATPDDRRAWFGWDEARLRWAPLRGQLVDAGARAALAETGGVYGLVADKVPPALVGVDPPSRGELRPDRYFVEAEFLDVGAGVSETGVTATLDGIVVPVHVAVDENRGIVRYVPTDLPPGLHTLRLSVADRAGNVAVESFDYLTAEEFRFTDLRQAPNPIRGGEGRLVFRLTQTADVRMDIYTADGRLIRSEELRDVVGDGFDIQQTRESFHWDVTNAAGRPVASGVYVVQLTARNSSDKVIRRTTKWAVVR